MSEMDAMYPKVNEKIILFHLEELKTLFFWVLTPYLQKNVCLIMVDELIKEEIKNFITNDQYQIGNAFIIGLSDYHIPTDVMNYFLYLFRDGVVKHIINMLDTIKPLLVTKIEIDRHSTICVHGVYYTYPPDIKQHDNHNYDYDYYLRH